MEKHSDSCNCHLKVNVQNIEKLHSDTFKKVFRLLVPSKF